jgi:hypothetical protein
LASPQEETVRFVTVPVALDHNRMLVDAEVQRKDGSWRKARLWVDTGNPEFFISETLARDLGIDLSATEQRTDKGSPQPLEVPPPLGVRIGGMSLNVDRVRTKVMFEPRWLFSTMHNDGNLPSTVLSRYHIVFDYPKLRLTVAEPGSLQPRGLRATASVHPTTGVVQIDAAIDKEKLSFALDNGASYSFTSDEVLGRLSREHPSWVRSTGALGCANIWGWWPEEPSWPVIRVPEILWGSVRLGDVGIVGLPRSFPTEPGLGAWYSQKTARPVDGFLGPNAFKAFRIEIDYANGAVYFEKGAPFDSHDMDLVGLTLRPEADGSYRVIGVARKDGKPVVDGVQPGDVLLRVGDLEATGATMGTVVDALRGKPGEVRTLVLDRNGKRLRIETKVERLL